MTEKEKRDNTQSQIDQTKEILDKAASGGWILDDGSKISGACKIGTVWLPIPPSQITISEVNENETVQTIRTPGNPTRKTGRQEIRIELEVFFPSLYDINTRFRPLLAQFLRTPFLPIENEHIRSIILPNVMWTKPVKTKRTRLLNPSPFDTDVFVREVSKDMSKGQWKELSDDFKDRVSEIFRREQNKLDVKIAKLNQQSQAGVSETEGQKINRELHKLMQRKVDLKMSDIAAELIDKVSTPLSIYNDEQIAIALRNLVISTVPGYPEALQCNLQLSVFNYYPYSDDFSFLEGIDDAIKQIEYFSNKLNLQYSNEVRKLFGKEVMYKDPSKTLRTTKDLSKSKPFIAYITPLLTGSGFGQSKDSIKMELDPQQTVLPNIYKKQEGTIDIGKRGFYFPSPENWLRVVSNPMEFKKLAFEYEISELNTEERENLDIMAKRIDSEVITDIEELFLELDVKKGILEKFKSEISNVWYHLKKIISLEVLQKKIDYWAIKMDDFAKQTLIFPFNVTQNGKDKFVKGEEYTIGKILTIFRGLRSKSYRGDAIVEKLKHQFDVKNVSNYGYQTLYKFAFSEDEDTVISGISASFDTKLTPVPLLSYSLPTFQYMGRNDWHVQITLQTCNIALLRILRSLSIKAAKGRLLKQRTRENWWINRLNSLYFDPEDTTANGLLKTIGLNNALFEDFVYESMRDKPGWWNVTIRLVQSDLDMFLYESLLPVGFYRTDVVDNLKYWLYKNYTWKHKNRYNILSRPTKYPYIVKHIFSQMRNFVIRMAYDVFYGGDLNLSPEIPDNLNEHTSDLRFLGLREEHIEEIIKSGFNKDVFNKRMRKIFNGGSESVKANYDVHVTNSTISVEKLIGYALYNGDILHEITFNQRLDRKTNFIVRNITFGRLQWALVRYFLQTLAIRCLNYAPAETYRLFTNFNIKKLVGKNKKAYTRKDLSPMHDTTLGVSGNNHDLYSSYLDLHLPAYRFGELSTPADFFYKKSKEMVNFDFLQERITKIEDIYMNAWKFQLVDSLGVYSEMRKTGDAVFPLSPGELKQLEEQKNNASTRMHLLNQERQRVGTTEFGTPMSALQLNQLAAIDSEIAELKKVGPLYEKEKATSDKFTTKSIEDRTNHILELSEEIDDFWEKRGESIRNLPKERKKELMATKSVHDIKQAIGISALLRLAAIHKRMLEEDTKLSTENLTGVDPQYDKSLLLRDNLIEEIEMFARTPAENLYGTVTPWSLENSRDIINRVKDSYNITFAKSKTKQMERAFPTLKLYFIEEDSKEWGAVDDYYMYNAVESVEVIKSKHSASSIANIVVSNISGNLTDPKSILRREAPLQEGTRQEQSLLTMYLREGTSIMIKGGYDNNPNNLDVMFYGKVVSSTLGDKVTIVAQSFGAELLEPVNRGVRKQLGFNSLARTHGDIAMWAINTLSGLQHFGSMSNLERLGLIDIHGDTPYYSGQKYRKWDYLRRLHPIFDFYFKFAVYDPRLENIYLPYSKLCMTPWAKMVLDLVVSEKKEEAMVFPEEHKNVFLATKDALLAPIRVVTEHNKDKYPLFGGLMSAVQISSTNFLTLPFWCIWYKTEPNLLELFYKSTFDWTVRDQNMWDVLNEITLYWEDFIVTTLPYNDIATNQYRETLYVGPRDGVYKYTDAFDSKESIEKIQAEIKEKRKYWGTFLNKEKAESVTKNYETYTELIDKLDKKRKDKGKLDPDQQVIYKSLSEEKIKLAPIKNYLDKVYNKNTKTFYRTTEQQFDSMKNFEDGNIILDVRNPVDLTTTGDARYRLYSGYRPVVNYYHVDSLSHIIENNIRASSEDISNHVIIKFPADPTVSQTYKFQTREFWADDNIRGGNIKTYVSEQYNIDPLSVPIISDDYERYWELKTYFDDEKLFGNLPRIYQVGYSVLANQMRPMYRGEITVIGMPHVKPYDVIFISDLKNDMWGPIEVETVKHRFSAQGFVTEITPNAIISYMNPAKVMELSFMQGLQLPIFGFLGDIMDLNLWNRFQDMNIAWKGLTALAMGIPVLAYLANPYWGIGIATFGLFLGSKAIFSLWDWGLGKLMGRDIIFLCGLWKGSTPLVAGMEGAYKDDTRVHYMDNVTRLFDFTTKLNPLE